MKKLLMMFSVFLFACVVILPPVYVDAVGYTKSGYTVYHTNIYECLNCELASKVEAQKFCGDVYHRDAVIIDARTVRNQNPHIVSVLFFCHER